jgi:quercetin dioxygenase-like cupin family protein
MLAVLSRLARHACTKQRTIVLEGSVVMQLKGGQQVTLAPGQTFYEGPDDVHLVDRNASTTQPAKFLVVFIKNKGAPVLVPVQ